jgi:hypothetical protein
MHWILALRSFYIPVGGRTRNLGLHQSFGFPQENMVRLSVDHVNACPNGRFHFAGYQAVMQ